MISIMPKVDNKTKNYAKNTSFGVKMVNIKDHTPAYELADKVIKKLGGEIQLLNYLDCTNKLDVVIKHPNPSVENKVAKVFEDFGKDMDNAFNKALKKLNIEQPNKE